MKRNNSSSLSAATRSTKMLYTCDEEKNEKKRAAFHAESPVSKHRREYDLGNDEVAMRNFYAGEFSLSANVSGIHHSVMMEQVEDGIQGGSSEWPSTASTGTPASASLSGSHDATGLARVPSKTRKLGTEYGLPALRSHNFTGRYSPLEWKSLCCEHDDLEPVESARKTLLDVPPQDYSHGHEAPDHCRLSPTMEFGQHSLQNPQVVGHDLADGAAETGSKFSQETTAFGFDLKPSGSVSKTLPDSPPSISHSAKTQTSPRLEDFPGLFLTIQEAQDAQLEAHARSDSFQETHVHPTNAQENYSTGGVHVDGLPLALAGFPTFVSDHSLDKKRSPAEVAQRIKGCSLPGTHSNQALLYATIPDFTSAFPKGSWHDEPKTQRLADSYDNAMGVAGMPKEGDHRGALFETPLRQHEPSRGNVVETGGMASAEPVGSAAFASIQQDNAMEVARMPMEEERRDSVVDHRRADDTLAEDGQLYRLRDKDIVCGKEGGFGNEHNKVIYLDPLRSWFLDYRAKPRGRQRTALVREIRHELTVVQERRFLQRRNKCENCLMGRRREVCSCRWKQIYATQKAGEPPKSLEKRRAIAEEKKIVDTFNKWMRDAAKQN